MKVIHHSENNIAFKYAAKYHLAKDGYLNPSSAKVNRELKRTLDRIKAQQQLAIEQDKVSFGNNCQALVYLDDDSREIAHLTYTVIVGMHIVRTMFVAPELRGQGFGTKILKEFQSRHEDSAIEITQEDIRELRAFYHNLGYESVGRGLFPNNLVMVKSEDQYNRFVERLEPVLNPKG
ncbi:GNAT family N-acetyltransferase [Vibrio splendidus]